MKVLVTGGTTWLGQSVVARLLAGGHDVAVLDAAPAPWRVALPRAVPVAAGSVADPGAVREALRRERPDAVLHREVLYGPETEQRLLHTVQVNVVGALAVFEAAAATGVRRVVYESSIGVYGTQAEHGPRPLPEASARFADPPHVYQLTQHAVEYLARRYRAATGLSLVGVRPSVCHSPLKDVGISRWSNDVVTLPALGRPVRLPYHAGQRSSLLWVDDCAEVYARLVERPDLRHEVYNTGGHDVSLRELAGLVQALLPGARLEFTEGSEQPLPWRIDGSRARDELGVSLRPLAETIRLHAEWARRLHGLPPLPA